MLVLLAFAADKYRQGITKRRLDDRIGQESRVDEAAMRDPQDRMISDPTEFQPPIPFTAYQVYSHLIPEEQGKVWSLEDDREKSRQMRQFLQKKFGTSSVANIDLQELKDVLEGEPLMKRTKYRKMVAIAGSRPVIKKGQRYRKDHLMASSFDKGLKNEMYGFKCLWLSVSEACETAKVTILNKNRTAGQVGIRTRPDTATSPEDYVHIDEIITFSANQAEHEVHIRIIDDHGWEPDEDFYVDLYDPTTVERTKLVGRDTESRVTILDDDKPGTLCFENPRIRHAVTNTQCVIQVKRIHDADGEVSVKYKTIDYEQKGTRAVPGIDYNAEEGVITFGN